MVYILENRRPKKSYKVKYTKILDSKISEVTLKSILD